MSAAAAAVQPAHLHHIPIRRAGAPPAVRRASISDADEIHALISRYQAAGQLLPRTREEISIHVDRFVVATDGRRVVGCADLAPLSSSVAEIRSLVVDERIQGQGLGRRLLAELVTRSGAAHFRQVCALTHSPGYFLKRGFSIVPHQWLPEKIERDCRTCAQFRQCGQHAVVLPLKTVHG